jgi:hypothetical protein
LLREFGALARRNLTPEQKSALRGRRYQLEKQAHGGERRSEESSPQSEELKTSERMAEELGVSPATIERDAQFVEGLDALAEVRACDPGRGGYPYRDLQEGSCDKTSFALFHCERASYRLTNAKKEISHHGGSRHFFSLLGQNGWGFGLFSQQSARATYKKRNSGIHNTSKRRLVAASLL